MTVRTVLIRVRGYLLYSGTRRTRPHEEACLTAFRTTLSADGQRTLDRQRVRLGLRQRSPDGRVVDTLENWETREEPWCEDERFRFAHRDYAVARLRLRPLRGPSADAIKADITCSDGKLATIEFHRPPGALRHGAEVVSIELLFDPMRPAPAETPPLPPSEAEGRVGDFLRAHGASDLRRPLSAEDRARFAHAIAARLPDDYAGFVTAAEGATLGDWRIHGLRDVWRQINPEGTYYVLAESERGGWVGLAQGDDSGELYWGLHEAHEDDTRRVGKALLPFVASPPNPTKWEEFPPREPDLPASLRHAVRFSAAVATGVFVIVSLVLWLLPPDLRQIVQVGPLQLNTLVGLAVGLFVFGSLIRAALPESRAQRSTMTMARRDS